MDKVSVAKVGRYEIIGILGSGPVAELLVAQDDTLRRKLTIKCLTEPPGFRDLARFQLEVKSATFRHPNIPVLYEIGVHEDRPFIAMEYVEGESLKTIIESRRELDLVAKLRIIEQVCTALGYAYNHKIIYGGLIPENVIVQPNGVVKIIDFGFASSPHDAVGLGPVLVASEIAGQTDFGEKVEDRLYLFSTAITLFRFLTGKDLFIRASPSASFKTIDDLRSALALALHEYPPALEEIIESFLTISPGGCYTTFEEFADALHRLIDDLTRTRIAKLMEDARPLTDQSRFDSALELLDEAIKLAPSNKGVRKLRKSIRERQQQVRRTERIVECLHRSDAALLSRKFDESLSELKVAQKLDPKSDQIKDRIHSLEEKKRRLETGMRALVEAERAKELGDIDEAARIANNALQDDPENDKLLALRTDLARQRQMEMHRERIAELVESTARALAAGDYPAAGTLLNDLLEIDSSNEQGVKLRQELATARELEQRRLVLEGTRLRVQDLIECDAYDQAFSLVRHALEQYPDELLLHCLKAEVEAGERRYDVTRVVDMAIGQANELFTSSPLNAISVLEQALDNMPGEIRLVECIRSLRQQMESRRASPHATTRLSKCRS